MSKGLEWRFGDELPEEELDRDWPQPQAWRRWWAWIVVLLLLVGGAYGWWRQRQQTLDQAEAQVERVARLELQALAGGDMELYMSLQDTVDEVWRQAQAAYTETFALPLPIQGITTTQTSVESARVVGERARVEIKHSIPLTDERRASFRAIRFYRLTDRGRWVHTKVDPDYGGRPVSLLGRLVEVRVRERDADWIEAVVKDMGALTSGYCDLISCQQNLPLTLDLGAALDEAVVPGDDVLPAPFLVGAPEDEAAELLWKASLEGFLLERLIDREIGPRPSGMHRGDIFRDRLYAWFRQELGLNNPPSLDSGLIREALDAGTWIPLWELWSLPPDDLRRPLIEAEIDLLLHFIEREHGAIAVGRLPRALRDAFHPGEGIVAVVREPWWVFRRRYLTYVREITADRSDRLMAFSSYDIMMRCWETVGSTSFGAIWGVRWDEPEPTVLSTNGEVGALLPVSWSPDGARLLTVQQRGDEHALYVLTSGGSKPQRLPGMPEGSEPVGSMGFGETGWSPDGGHLAYRTPDQGIEGGIVDVRNGEHAVFEGDFVAWSPDGRRLIYARPIPWHWSPELRVQTFWIWDRDGAHARSLGHGYTAGWSPDGARIAYVTPEPALRTFDTMTGGTTALLDKSSLRRTLGFTPTLSPVSGQPFEMDWSPTGEWIALAATRSSLGGSEETLTLLVRDGDHRVLDRQQGGLLRLSWSPDGHWLTTVTFERDHSRVIVRDVQGNVLFGGEDAFVSWSSDGRHMAVAKDPLLRILEIESGTWKDFEIPGTCRPVMWNPHTKGGRGLVPGQDWRSSIQSCDLPHCQP